MPSRPTRRASSSWLAPSLLWLAAAACAAGGPASPTGGAAQLERCAASSPTGSRCAEALSLLGGLAPGSRVGLGQVMEVAVTGDRVVVSLAGDGGEVAGVEVVRFDPAAPPPPARAGGLALYLRTDTRGGLTPAWQFALAEALAAPMAGAAVPIPAWLGVLGAAPAERPPRAP